MVLRSVSIGRDVLLLVGVPLQAVLPLDLIASFDVVAAASDPMYRYNSINRKYTFPPSDAATMQTIVTTLLRAGECCMPTSISVDSRS